MIIEVLQIVDQQGQKLERWRLTTRNSEKSKPCGLCVCIHNSYESAWNCIDAWSAAKKLSGDSL